MTERGESSPDEVIHADQGETRMLRFYVTGFTFAALLGAMLAASGCATFGGGGLCSGGGCNDGMCQPCSGGKKWFGRKNSCSNCDDCTSCDGGCGKKSRKWWKKNDCDSCDDGCGTCGGCCDLGCCGLGCCGHCLGWSRSLAIQDEYPLGAVMRAHHHQMQMNGEAADFILFQKDFVGQTAELTPDGKDKVLEMAARMRNAPYPVVVERMWNNADPELDAHRRNLVAQILVDLGNPDANTRVFVSPAYGPGKHSMESVIEYWQYTYQGLGNGQFGFGGGGFGGGFGGGGGGGFGGGFGGF
jgi:hypothetical protein